MSNSVGVVFEEQGRLGAAVSALQDAVQALRDGGDRSGTMAQALTDLAGALAKAGRGQESAKPIEEAQGIVRNLKNEGLEASLANAEGDVHFYQGDLKAAKESYQQAERLASHSADKDVLLTSKLNLARLAVGEGHSPAATVAGLSALAQQADSLGKKYISVVSTTLMAQAFIENKEYAHAKQELQRNLSRAEKLGLRLQNAKIHFLLGRALRLGGTSSEATAQYREALRLLDDIRKEPGAEHIIERFDQKSVYEEATKYTQ
jgi:tetratricopeptide (TPR) repeat protein